MALVLDCNKCNQVVLPVATVTCLGSRNSLHAVPQPRHHTLMYYKTDTEQQTGWYACGL